MAKPTLAELFDLTGKVAVVTGGAMGIGQAVAARLVEAGAAVLLSDINLPAATETARQLCAQGGRAAATQADVASVPDAQRTIQEAVDLFGRLDILVNNAGISTFASVAQMSEQMWDSVLDVNLKGMFFHAQAAAAKMQATGRGGKIVNIASIAALRTVEYLHHYNVSKAGVAMLTRTLARELGPEQINVNAVAPGGISTPGMQAQLATMIEQTQMSQAEVDRFHKQYIASVPLRRGGEPDDIARAVLFLASPAADYITGSLLVADGGFMAT